ncbi:MAG: cobalamin biosynthesis protein CobW [Neomegalonema sp.]|nr:cobalamin biosynthesis protein CobW [Neomegalonema sp.]
MMGESKIPATVITGFLGAGKTTLIRHLLENAGGRRVALIVNEFGDVGVDGEILKGCGDEACAEDDIVELANGCICCTVAEDFIPTMTALLDREQPPEHIVIETSGLALPQPLVRAFAWPEIRTRVTVDGVVTVVDAAAIAEGRVAMDEAALAAQRAADDALDHATPIEDLFVDQLACADLVVLNKADLIDTDQRAEISGRLSDAARPGVGVLTAERGRLSPTLLLGLGVGAEENTAARAERRHVHDHDHDHGDDHDHDHHHHHHHHDHGHDAFESQVIEFGEITDKAAFETRLAEALKDLGVLRLKGFAAIAGKPMRLAVQAAGPRVETYFDQPFRDDAPRITRLVAISTAGFDAAQLRERLTQ